jgi:hypothetical protein
MFALTATVLSFLLLSGEAQGSRGGPPAQPKSIVIAPGEYADFDRVKTSPNPLTLGDRAEVYWPPGREVWHLPDGALAATGFAVHGPAWCRTASFLTRSRSVASGAPLTVLGSVWCVWTTSGNFRVAVVQSATPTAIVMDVY